VTLIELVAVFAMLGVLVALLAATERDVARPWWLPEARASWQM
jgi:hypothetical protein